MARNTVGYWAKRADQLIELREYHAALECYVNATEIEPKNAEVLRKIVLILIQLKRYPEAVQHLERAIEIHPETNDRWCAEAWYSKAWVLEQLQRHSDALQCYDRAIEIDKKYADALNDKAYILAGINTEPSLANELVDKALSIDKDNANYLDTKGVILSNRGEYKQAIEYFDRALEKLLARNTLAEQEILYHKGKAQLRSKDYDGAVQTIDKALEIKEDFAEAHDAKAVALSRQNRNSEALEEVKRALQIKPSLKPAQEHLASLKSAPSGGGGGNFFDFWTSSRNKKILAFAIVVLTSLFLLYSIYAGDIKIERKLGPAQNVTVTTTTENVIPSTSLVIVGLIIVILLLPDITKLKFGPTGIELELSHKDTLPPAEKGAVQLNPS